MDIVGKGQWAVSKAGRMHDSFIQLKDNEVPIVKILRSGINRRSSNEP